MDVRGTGRNVPRSELICPRDFLQSWDVEALESTNVAASNENESTIQTHIANKMGISAETVKELSEVCGKNTLFRGTEPKSKIHLLQLKTSPLGVDLESVKYQMEQRQQRQEDEGLKVHVNRHMKYNNLDDYMILVSPSVDPKELDPQYKVQNPNVVLTVQITKCLMQGDKQQVIRERETYLVLGTQTLTELRDKIKCSSDAIIPGDYSCMPDVNPESLQKAGDIFKSSFFFMENVFYNDTRLPDNKDYSKPIMKWAEEVMPDTEMKTADMAKTKFLDLTLRLGQHYLFMHQGNCEHAVLFTDMRLFDASDSQDLRQYPLPFISRTRNRAVCQGCLKLSARWIVRQAAVIPTDPCFLCRVCFKTLMYTKQGKKVCNFRAQPFVDFNA